VAATGTTGVPGGAPRAATGRPLAGRRVVVTRPESQAGALVTLLEAAGAEVVSLPTIRLEPPEDWGELDGALRRLHAYHWVLFTSANGVAAFQERLQALGLPVTRPPAVRAGAIGPATAEALRRMGWPVETVAAEYRAEGLLDAVSAGIGPGTRVLLVRAAEARDVLPRGLQARGADVTVAPAYRTVKIAGAGSRLRDVLAAGVDAVTFTSPSTVHGFVAQVPESDRARLLSGVVLAAIGPITQAALAEHGLRAGVVAPEYTIPALAAALTRHLAAGHPS
jgi:uroporphyrinogen III methyltransferase/synthase